MGIGKREKRCECADLYLFVYVSVHVVYGMVSELSNIRYAPSSSLFSFSYFYLPHQWCVGVTVFFKTTILLKKYIFQCDSC